MVGIVIVTHGDLAEALLDTASLIVGELPETIAVGLQPEDGPSQAKAKVEQAVSSLKECTGIILLVDLQGGTPCTICLGCLQECQAEVVTGVNLGMLLKAPFLRSKPGLSLRGMADEMAALARDSIRVVTISCCETL